MEKYGEALAVAKGNYASATPINKHVQLQNQGFCYWELGDSPQALATFQALEKDNILQENQNPASYYQAVTYLKMGEKEKALDLLERLSSKQGHVYRERAQQLLFSVKAD